MNAHSKTTPMNAYILLDRTGSMAPIWAETLSSINSYVERLAAEKIDATITLAMFDSNDGTQFDVIRRSVDVTNWQTITDRDATPRGYTPLYDAIGRLMGLANTDAADRASIIIVTDGQENASREVTREGAKAMLDRVREKGWDVVFLGANFDAFSQAASLGGTAAQTLNIAPGAMQAAMAGPMVARTKSYHIGGAPAAFSDEDRKVASKG
jgi:hypothetical protein